MTDDKRDGELTHPPLSYAGTTDANMMKVRTAKPLDIPHQPLHPKTVKVRTAPSKRVGSLDDPRVRVEVTAMRNRLMGNDEDDA